MQAAVGVNLAVGAEGFHHRLLACLRVVHAVDNDIAVREDRINIAVAALVVRAQVAPVVRADRRKALPVVLRMHEHRIVLRGVEIEHRLEHLVLHLDLSTHFSSAPARIATTSPTKRTWRSITRRSYGLASG